LDSEREDMELRELFRTRLENAGIDPDPSVNARLMKKLARREFVTFNPARFNAYYLGGIIAAGIAAAILLAPSEKTESRLPESAEEKVEIKAEVRTIIPNERKENYTAAIKADADKGITSKASERKEGIISAINKKEEISGKPSEADQTERIPDVVKSDILVKDAGSKKLVSSQKSSDKLFLPSVNEGCVPLRVRFVCTATEIDSYRWTFGDGGVSHDKTPEWIFDVDGEYKVTLEVFSGNNLVGTSSEIIKVQPRPVANFEYVPDKAVIPDDEIRFVNYSTEAVRYQWNFGDGTYSDLFEPQHSYTQYGQYDVKLVVSNEFGCSDSVIVQNAFAGSKYFIEFPNAFMPNPDGPSGGIYSLKSDESAEVFHPVSSGVSDYQLKIFSKLGILIFESKDLNVGWDGYFKGQLSNSGVYIWKVRGKYRNGEPFTKMGDVTLLRIQ
jgi:PKD repeat protein